MPSFPRAVALAGTHCLCFLNPPTSGAHHTWPGDEGPGGGRCHWYLVAHFSASFWFLQSGCSLKLYPQPCSSLCPSILFLGDGTPCSCFSNHPLLGPLYLSSQHPPSQLYIGISIPRYARPLDSTFLPKVAAQKLSPFLQRNLPSPRPGPRARGCQDLLAPSPFCTALKPLLPPLKAPPSKPHQGRGRSEYSVSLLGLCPACSLLPDSTQFGSTSGPGLCSGAQEAGHSTDW